MKEQQGKLITLVEAAARLRIPYQDAHRLVLIGHLAGQKRGSRWQVTAESVDRLKVEGETQPARQRASNA